MRPSRDSRGHLRQYHTGANNHQQILQNGPREPDKIQPSVQELHLPERQRGGQNDTAQEERAVRRRGDACVQNVVKVKKQVFNVNYEYNITAVEGR